MKKLIVCLFLSGLLIAKEDNEAKEINQEANIEQNVDITKIEGPEEPVDTTARYTFGLAWYAGVEFSNYKFTKLDGVLQTKTIHEIFKSKNSVFKSAFTFGFIKHLTRDVSWDMNFSILGISTNGFLVNNNYYYSALKTEYGHFGFFGGVQISYLPHNAIPKGNENKGEKFTGHKFFVGNRLGLVIDNTDSYIKSGLAYDFALNREVSDDTSNFGVETIHTPSFFIQYVLKI